MTTATLIRLPEEMLLRGLDPYQVEEVAPGTIYLLHLDTPLRAWTSGYTWSHYIGFARPGRLVGRLDEHWKGRGASFLRKARAQGCTFHLARTWPGDYKTERKIKNQGGASRFCPSCGVIPQAERQAYRDLLGRYVTPGGRGAP